MALPAAGFFTLGLSGTSGASALNDWLAATRQYLGTQDESELTIASGSVTATVAMHTLDTESDAATDDLTNIVVSGMSGQLLLVRAENSARFVTLKHESGGAGQMSFGDGSDCLLDATTKYVLFWIDTGASPVTLREVARFGFGAGVSRETVVAKTTAYTVTIHDQGKTFTNEGATAIVVFTLPTAVAGQRYRWVVTDADGIRITAGAGDTIRRTTSVTAAAGSIESTAIGSVVELEAVDATQWIALNGGIGTWT